jgi:hypothetical protein
MNYLAISHWFSMNAIIPKVHETHDSRFLLRGGLEVVTSMPGIAVISIGS